MSVLDQICEDKHAHVAAQKTRTPLVDIKSKIEDVFPARPFIARLQEIARNNAPSIICEVKKASPSKGLIRADFDPALIARIYEDNGAACVSVLTDTPYFQGEDAHFSAVRVVTNLPLLRKDFMVDTYQIYESRALGADCVLLIMAALDDSMARDLYALALDLGMDVLIEVHNEQELDRALALNPQMIGVNNRNLKTLEVDVQTSFDLIARMPENIVKIAESGLCDFNMLERLQNVGYEGFLIGESLMREDDIALSLRKIRGTD